MKQSTGIFLLLLLCFVNVYGEPLQPFTLHDSLGVMIDSTENTRYHILGPTSGYVKGWLFKTANKRYRMFVIIKEGQQYRVLLQNLYLRHMDRIQKRLNRRIERDKSGGYLFKTDQKYLVSNDNLLRLELTDGSIAIGRLTGIWQETLIIKTIADQLLSIDVNTVYDIATVDEFGKTVKYYVNDPRASHLYVMPTGHALKSGEVLVLDYWFILPSIKVGVTDFASVGGGYSVFLGTANALYFNAQLSKSLSSWANLGAGMNVYSLPDNQGGINQGYAMLTLGGQNTNLTLGMGGFFLGKNSEVQPMYIVGGGIELFEHCKFNFESWTWQDEYDRIMSGFSCAGFRFYGDRFAMDLGVFDAGVLFDAPLIVALPWIGMSYKFDVKKDN